MFSPPLKAAVVAPLKIDGRVLGALSAYSSTGEPFSDDHQYAMERIAAAFAQTMLRLLDQTAQSAGAGARLTNAFESYVGTSVAP